MRSLSLLVLSLLLVGPSSLRAQQADTLVVDLGQIDVTTTRTTETAATAPLAVAIEARGPMELATEPGVSLESVLRYMPGLWIADRENFALGERISVRGMGARAGFGVRGVQVVLDGIPLTLPDGQAGITIVDPALIRRAELVRGPASAFWGNGSGGVLFLNTIPQGPSEARARVVGGSHGLLRTDAEVSHYAAGAHHFGGAVSHVSREGYRNHSAYDITRGRAFWQYGGIPGVQLRAVGALEWSPRQQHPGSLTPEEWAEDPRQAQPFFVNNDAGKATTQGQLGLLLNADTPLGQVTGTAYGIARDLDNPLPFAYIDLNRQAAGTRLGLERRDGPFVWALGFDTGLQRDDRQNWTNASGERGTLRLDQFETVASAAAFSRASFEHGPLTLSAALRYDRTRFEANDRFLDDGDQSGSRLLAAWSPTLGASYRVGTALAFVSASTAFETPTTTELANRPDGSGGFNPQVEPQRTRGLEAGVRGTTQAGRLFYDLAVYGLDVRDQLVSFEGADGRTYYQNVEASQHRGAEALVEWRPMRGLGLSATYTLSHLAFGDESGALAGNRVPGVPEHRLAARARVSRHALFTQFSVAAIGPTWADDANTTRADGYTVLDVRFGHEGVPVDRALLQPFVRVDNVFDARYVGSVNLNANQGRFFEPGAGRGVQAGLSVRFL